MESKENRNDLYKPSYIELKMWSLSWLCLSWGSNISSGEDDGGRVIFDHHIWMHRNPKLQSNTCGNM